MTLRDHWPLRPKIRTIDELSTAVTEEAIKLGIDPSQIDLKLYHDTWLLNSLGSVEKKGDRYLMNVSCNLLGYCTRNIVRHELSHIANNDLQHRSFFRYLFIEEPRAVAYATFGVKL